MYINVCWYCKNYYVNGSIPVCIFDDTTYPLIKYRVDKCYNFELDPCVNIDLDESEL